MWIDIILQVTLNIFIRLIKLSFHLINSLLYILK